MEGENGRYDLEKAQTEANSLSRKVAWGKAEDYSDAEAQLDHGVLEYVEYRDLLNKGYDGVDKMSAEERETLRKQGYYFLNNRKNPFEAKSVFKALHDYEGLRKTVDFLLKEDAKSGEIPGLLNYIEDYEGLRDFLNHELSQHNDAQGESLCEDAFYPLDRLMWNYVNEYLAKNGIKNATGGINRGVDLVTIKNLIQIYDIGVPIARGGLIQGAIADLWGMETRIVDIAAHNRKVARGKWISTVKSEDFDGKNVLLFDKDAITGASIRKTVKMVAPSKPASIGVYFTHKVIKSPKPSFGTITEGLPPEVTVFSHNTVPLKNAGDIYLEAHEKLGSLYGQRRIMERAYEEEAGRVQDKYPDVAKSLQDYSSRLVESFDSLNPQLAGVSEVRQSILKQLELNLQQHKNFVQTGVYDNFHAARRNFTKMLDRAASLPVNFEADLVRARYTKQARELAEKRQIENPHFPSSPLSSFTAARKAVEKGFEVALIVGPEGFGYEPYFNDLGIQTVAVNIPESGPNEPRSFRALDDLEILKGKKVLVVEDDVHTGATLRTLLEQVKSYQPEQFGLYLGQPEAYQKPANIPEDFKESFIASIEDTEQEGVEFQEYLKSKGLKVFKK